MRGQASKGQQGRDKYRKSFKKGTKKGPKWYPGGTWEPPRSDLEISTHSQYEKYEKVTLFGVLFGAWSDHWRHQFFDVFRVPSRNDFWAIWEPKRPPKGRPLELHLVTFFENPKSVILRPLTRFRQVEGVRIGDFFDTFSILFRRRLLGGLRRRILRLLGSPWGSAGEPFGAQKATFFEVRF